MNLGRNDGKAISLLKNQFLRLLKVLATCVVVAQWGKPDDCMRSVGQTSGSPHSMDSPFRLFFRIIEACCL